MIELHKHYTMRKLLILLFILFSLNSIGQITTASYTNKGARVPYIDASTYKVNGVTGYLSQWTTTGSFIYFMNNVGIGVNNPSDRLHVVGSALFDIGANGQFVISSTSQARELLRINNIDVYKTFEIDGANNGYKVGIGTATPTNKLDVVGAIGTTDLYVSTGKIGVGTASPSTGIHVLGATPKIRLEESVGGYWWTLTSFTGIGANYGGFKIGTSLKDNCLTIQNETGNVGVNKEEAEHTLDVNGTIRATGNVYFELPHVALYRTTDLTISATQNIWYKLTGLTAKDAGGLTVTGDSVQLTNKGHYLVNYTISFSGNNNEIWEAGVFKNGALDNPSQLRYTSTADVGNMSIPVYISSDGDDWFSFKIRNTSDNDDPTVKRISIIISTIHLIP